MSKKIVFTAIVLLTLSSLNAQNVGIDETSPGSKFSVKGNLSVGPDYSSHAAPTNGAIIEGQIGIGTNSPDSNAILDIESTQKGIFIPRLSHTQRLAINNPSKGIIVFDTDSNTLYFNNGAEWFSLVATDNINTVVGCYHWPMGSTGPTGTNGTNGSNGSNGATGPTGATGTNGSNGTAGATGPTGATGTAGTNGTNGSDGAAGATGVTGATGSNGTNGTAGATGTTGAGYSATSTSSITIGTGSKTITTQSGVAYLANDRVRISNAATNYMDGVVTSYSGTALVVNVDYVAGSGAFTSWNIGIAGNEGTVGATGAAGINGVDGTNGSNGTNGATSATGATGATGYLSSGSSAGNTPYWNGSSWVINSSNVYNDGGNVGIGTSSPAYNLDVTGTGRYTGALKIGAYTLPNTDGTSGYVLSTNGSGTVSWQPAASTSIGSSYALTASVSDPTAGSGSWTEIGEITVPVNSGDVILTNAFFSATLATTGSTGISIRVTRSQTSGSGTVGTAVCYSSSGEKSTPWWVSLNAINRETGLTAGTWYYKFWVITSSYSGTPNYQCIISKAQ